MSDLNLLFQKKKIFWGEKIIPLEKFVYEDPSKNEVKKKLKHCVFLIVINGENKQMNKNRPTIGDHKKKITEFEFIIIIYTLLL